MSLRSKGLLHRTRAQSRCWTPSRACLDGCAGQASDAVSAYLQVQMEQALKLLRLPCDMDTLFHVLDVQKAWDHIQDLVFHRRENLYARLVARSLWERKLESSFTISVDKSPRNAYVLIENVDRCFQCTWTISKIAGKTTKKLSHMWDKGELKEYLKTTHH